jgi:hypothetical protein
MFGSGKNKFTQEERVLLLDRLGTEPGVHVERVFLPGRDEKGVDGTVAIEMENFLDHNESAVLVSADRDFVPFLRRMRQRGKKVVTVALNDQYPREITNEAYYTLGLRDRYAAFFEYSYPAFKIEDLDHETLRDLISNADDREVNRIQVDVDGDVHIVKGTWDGQSRPGVQLRFESFGRGNEYVGPKAASDEEHVHHYLGEIQKAWELGARGFKDYPVDSVWRARRDQ